MTPTISSTRLAAGLGLLIGLTVASLAVASWRLPPGGLPLGADLTVAVAPSGELEMSPRGPILSASGLRASRPSGGARGSFSVRNQTSTDLALRVRAQPSGHGLDDSLLIDVKASGRALFHGPLRSLRGSSDGSFVLESGATGSVDVRAWIPHEDQYRYRGRLVPLRALAARSPRGSAGAIENVLLELEPKPVGG